MCTWWPVRAQPCPQSCVCRGLATDLSYPLSSQLSPWFYLLLLKKKITFGKLKRHNICYIGQSLEILPLLMSFFGGMILLLSYRVWWVSCISPASRQKAPCTEHLWGSVHSPGTFSAGWVWPLTVLGDGAGSALQSEDQQQSQHRVDTALSWEFRPCSSSQLRISESPGEESPTAELLIL